MTLVETGPSGLKSRLLAQARARLPLAVRLRLAAALASLRRVDWAQDLAASLLRDLRRADPKRFHKFAWAHHLALYGRWYESADLFRARKLNGTREANELFLHDLNACLRSLDLDRRADIRSVIDVGCSMGYLLRQLETEFFPDATRLLGIDIDREATRIGRRFLDNAGSGVSLLAGDLEQLSRIVADETFDLGVAAGSLSYIGEADVERAVGQLLSRTRKLVAIVGLADPRAPNGAARASALRTELGGMWVHNFEQLVARFGWHVIHTRWRPPAGEDQQGIYFVFASPLAQAAAVEARRLEREERLRHSVA